MSWFKRVCWFCFEWASDCEETGGVSDSPMCGKCRQKRGY